MQETAFYISKSCLLQGKMPPFVLLVFISRFLLHICVMCRLSSLSLYPFHYYVYGVLLFVIRQFMAFFYAVPFLHAATAATSCCMLCGEYRMPAHWGLPAVVGY